MRSTWTIRVASLLFAGALIGCSDDSGDQGGFIPGENAPPVVTLASPATGSHFPESDDVFASGVEVVFIGSAEDPDGPDLEESAFVWSSDLDGEIGTGRLIGVDTLSAGDHLITLTVRDVDNLLGTATVAISITP
mgnify:CR=1 FL=1